MVIDSTHASAPIAKMGLSLNILSCAYFRSSTVKNLDVEMVFGSPKYAMIPTMTVYSAREYVIRSKLVRRSEFRLTIKPSMMKIQRQPVKPPAVPMEDSPRASRPPKAPDKEALV
jgi:hypothetical protein